MLARIVLGGNVPEILHTPAYSSVHVLRDAVKNVLADFAR